jgi:uncharacterized damage-inducible protein DinB
MSDRQFAAWVEPIAAQYRANRAESLQFARTLGAEQLVLPTGDTGWSVRDELVHIAGADPFFLRTAAAFARGEKVDVNEMMDIDGRNTREMGARAGRTLEEIATELESNGDALQELLATFTAEDESRVPEGFPVPFGRLVESYGGHERYHLGQIRAAIDGAGRKA